MTNEQFKTTSFVYGMKVLYKGEEREVKLIDFFTGELSFEPMSYESLWVDFSEVELIKPKE
jgi:hypothetical protein